jgi:hypothetical protein
MKKIQAIKKKILGNLSLFLKIKSQLESSGCTRQSTSLIDWWIALKQDWWQKATNKN